MAILHQNLALMGLWPEAITSTSIANLGYYETEITITPVVQSSGGGGYVPSFRGTPDRYEVKIRIKFNDKVYEDISTVTDDMARVTAELYGISEFREDNIMVAINGIQIHNSEVSITAFQK
jgi:hypothetical protein